MGDIRIVGHTIAELSKGPGVLASYRDPFGYLTGFTAAWVDFLKENPAANRDDQALILAVDGDMVAGKLGMYASSASIDGTKHRTFWLSAFFLQDEYKLTGAGGLMLLKAINHSKCLVLNGGPREDARALYLGTGFMELGPLRRHVYFCRTEVALRKLLRVPLLPSMLSVLTTPLLRLYYSTRRGPKSDLEFKLVGAFGNEIDSLLENRDGSYFPRDAATLNWVLRFRKNLSPFQIFREGQCVGYCLLRTKGQSQSGPPHHLPAMRVGSLLDYYLYRGTYADKNELIDFCLEFCRRARVDVFECQSLGDNLEKVCSSRGMVHLGGNRVFFRPPPGLRLSPQTPWSLTQAEGDEILS